MKSIKSILSILCVVFYSSHLKGQDYEDFIDSLESKMKAFKSSAEFNKYLLENDWISQRVYEEFKTCSFETIRSPNDKDSVFEPSSVYLYPKKKNLFGDSTEELIVITRMPYIQSRLYNYFYYENGQWHKVPGQIEYGAVTCHYDLIYWSQDYIKIKPNSTVNFYFHKTTQIGAIDKVTHELWEIAKDTIYKILDYETVDIDQNDSLFYYRLKIKEFELIETSKKSEPKELHITLMEGINTKFQHFSGDIEYEKRNEIELKYKFSFIGDKLNVISRVKIKREL